MRRIGILVTFCVLGMGLALSGCGPSPIPEGQTRITFRPGRSTESLNGASLGTASVMSGGLFIYLRGVNGTPFVTNFFLHDESASASFFVPNGSYRVGAYGWSAADFSGTVRCGFGNGGNDIALKGGTQDIEIVLSTSPCANEAFAPVSYSSGGQFLPLKIKSCRDLSSVTAAGSTCTTGLIGSFRVSLPIFKAGDGKFTVLTEIVPPTSSCFAVGSGVGTSTSRIPVGPYTQALLPLVIAAYSGGDCGATTGSLIGTYSFSTPLNASNAYYRTGSAAEVSATTGMSAIFSDGSYTTLFLRDL